MTPGYLFNGQCYSTSSEAVDAALSSGSPALSAGATSYLAWFEKVSGVWYVRRQTISTGGAVTDLGTTAIDVPAFPSCDVTGQFFDGVTMGWGIATAMVMAWGFSKIRQAAR